MKFSIILIMAIAITLAAASVNASVNEVNYGFYGAINDDGSLNTTQSQMTDFNAIGFVCVNDDCSNVSGTLWSGAVMNSGSSSQMTLVYPTDLQQAGYGVFFYKDGYFPYEAKITYSGTGNAPGAADYFTKKTNCQVPINHLIISHNGTNVTVSVTLDAGVSSPVQSAGPLNYVPDSIAYLYAVDSKVDFRFIGPQNVSLTQNVNLPASSSKEVYASTTLLAGQYVIEVESNTIDSKCINSIPNKLNSNLLIENNRTNATLPLIAIISPEAKNYTNKTILVNLRAINATSVLYNYNGTNVSYTNPTYVNFNEGRNTLTAYAINNLTTAVASVTFYINSTGQNNTNVTRYAPYIAIISPQAKTYFNKSVLVNITSRNATSVWFNYNGTNVSYTNPIYLNFTDGLYTLRAYANNAYGTNQTSVIFRVNTTNGTTPRDTTPPAAVFNLTLISKTNTSLTWSWTNPSDSDFNQAIIYLDDVNVANTSSSSYFASNLLPNTAHTIRINTKDLSGNINFTNVTNMATTLSNPEENNNGGGGGSPGASKKKVLNDTLEESVKPKLDLSTYNASDNEYVAPNFISQSKQSNTGMVMIILIIASICLLILLLFVLASSRRR